MVQQLSTNTFGTAKWIVSSTLSNGTHTTIASALTSASSGETIFIRPGTYTENLTLKAGVNLAAYICDSPSGQVTISGKCSYSSAGQVNISGINLQTNSDYALEVTGSAASRVFLNECRVTNTNNTAINFTSSSASATIYLNYCSTAVGATNALFTSSSAGSINFWWCLMSSGSTTASSISAGAMQMSNCYCAESMSFSGTAQMIIFNSSIRTFGRNITCVTMTGTSSGFIANSLIQSGTASAISVGSQVIVTGCTIYTSNANAITGAGTISYAGLDFGNTSSTINTTTQTVLNSGPRIQFGNGVAGTGGCQAMSGTGSPSGAVTAPKGSLFLRTDGSGVNDRAYINTDAGTTWTAIVTVA